MTHSITIKNGILVEPKHPLNGQLVSVAIIEGRIVHIGNNPPQTDTLIDAEGGFISAGWFDAFATLPDPGAEWKERLETFAEASTLAGFTQSAVLAGNDPLPDKSASIIALKNRVTEGPTQILPLGAASENLLGKEMAEVYDLTQAGSIAQTDGIQPHGSDALRAKLFEYCHSLNIPYLVHPYNQKWVSGGQIHEGEISVNLGLKGIPPIAETTALLADIELAKWLGVPLRVLGISTQSSIEIIKQARTAGVEIWAAVPIMNLLYSHESIGGFDERFKVMPPLRGESDKQALRKALFNGDIQAIISNHTPEDIETQKVEFDYALPGAATLSGFIERLFENFEDSELVSVIHALSKGNRAFVGQPDYELKEDSMAQITVISRNAVRKSSNLKGSIAYNKLPINTAQNGGLVGVIRGIHYYFTV